MEDIENIETIEIAKTEKKGFFSAIKTRVADAGKKFLEVIKQYPVAIGVFFISSLFFAYIEKDYSENIKDIAMFIYRFSLAALFCEELLKSDFIQKRKKLHSKTFKILLIVFAAAVAALVSFYPADSNNGEYLSRFRWLFYAYTVLGTIYMMFRRLRRDFETYVISTFVNVFQIGLIYGLFALGLALLYLIFTILIYDADYTYLAMIETVLGAGIYAPALVIGFSTIGESGKDSKFAKVVIGYSLIGLLSAAFVIVYIYIIKILITGALPKNELFNIISAIFTLGIPIWTMSRYYKDELPGKVASVLPFAFAPLIILQGICIGIRINEYALTITRYAGIVLIVFECIYLFLYIFKKGKHISKILPAAAAVLTVCLIIPVANAYAVCTASQGARIEKFLAAGIENTSKEDKVEAYELYKEIEDYGPEGRNYLESKYGKTKSEFLEYLGMNDEDVDYYYFDYDKGLRRQYSNIIMPTDMDISGYSRMDHIECAENLWDEDEYTDNLPGVNTDQLSFYKTSSSYYGETLSATPDYVLNLTEIINDYIESDDEQLYFSNNNYFKLPDGKMLFIRDLNILFDEESKRIGSVNIEGFIFIP